MSTLSKHTDRASTKPGSIQVFRRSAVSLNPKHRALRISASLLYIRHPKDLIPWTIAACHAGAERIHIDVNDCNERPKGTVKAEGAGNRAKLFGPRQLCSVKGAHCEAGFQTPIDVHLVIEQPSEELLDSYLDAGVDSVAIHWVTLACPIEVDRKTGGNKKNAFSICRHEVILKETDKNSCLSLIEA